MRELQVCEQAARKAGGLLLELQHRVQVREKGPADLVTEADLAAQAIILETLRAEFPADPFLGEEEDSQLTLRDDWTDLPRCWVVDPLDGTTNFVHGLDNFSVSIALLTGGVPELGVVYDPTRDHCFVARRGAGARLNGRPLSGSPITQLDQALVAVSLPARVDPDSDDVQRLLRVLYQAQAIRRMGSAALNLCYVAQGSLDAYWASSVQVWDVAAGLLMVQEAGGLVEDLRGEPVNLRRPQLVASGTAELGRQLRELLA